MATVLLVDDDPGAIQIMGRILAGEAELRFATNGPDALRLARKSEGVVCFDESIVASPDSLQMVASTRGP